MEVCDYNSLCLDGTHTDCMVQYMGPAEEHGSCVSEDITLSDHIDVGLLAERY